MAVKSSGPLSFSEIQSELGGSNPISLSEYYKDGTIINNDIHDPNGIPTASQGAISVFDFYSCAKRQFMLWSGGSPANGRNSGNMKTHLFTGGGTLSRTRAPIGTGRDTMNYIVIAGGGGAGAISGGGGGAGGFKSGSFSTGSSTSYTMTIGSGGARGGARQVSGVRHPTKKSGQGGTSSIGGVVSCDGGGGGGSFNFNGSHSFMNGGSGGGGSGEEGGGRGTGISGQGHNGGRGADRESTLCAGGGGGAGGAGIGGIGIQTGHEQNPGPEACEGGPGINITGFPGANGVRGGGGSGGGLRIAAPSPGGGGGHGGAGPAHLNSAGGDATASTGGGGGGGGYNGNGVGSFGGNGGSGIIAVKYQFKT